MKRLLIAAALLFVPVFMAGFVATSSVSAQDQPPAGNKKDICEGIGIAGGGGTDCNENAAGLTVNRVIASAVNIISLIVGVAAVIMVIIGGFKYITSNGDSNSISSAKNTILYAIIGLVIVALAQGIVRFVMSRL